MSRYKLTVGLEQNSPSLIANGKHTQADTYASLAVLAGLMGYYDHVSGAIEAQIKSEITMHAFHAQI